MKLITSSILILFLNLAHADINRCVDDRDYDYPWSSEGCDTSKSAKANECCDSEHAPARKDSHKAACRKENGDLVDKPKDKPCSDIKGASMVCIEKGCQGGK